MVGQTSKRNLDKHSLSRSSDNGSVMRKGTRRQIGAEESALEDFLFGDLQSTSIIGHILESSRFASAGISADDGLATSYDREDRENEISFLIDTKPEAAAAEESDSSCEVESTKAFACAWHDNDDDEIEVDLHSQNRLKKMRVHESESVVDGSDYAERLRSRFSQSNTTSKWASIGQNEEVENFPESFRSSNSMISNKSRVLISGKVAISRVRDANIKECSHSVISSVKWHNNAQVIFTAGLDKTLRLFSIDGRENSKLQSVHFSDMPIHDAQWLPNGREIIVSGRRKFFYCYNVDKATVTKIPNIRGRDEKSLESFKVSPCGKFIVFIGDNGEIIIVSTSDMQEIGSVRMNGTARGVAFTPDMKSILSVGGDSQVYQWDLGSRRCVKAWSDEGAIGTSALAIANDMQYVATGGPSGIVNIYSGRQSLFATAGSKPLPEKSLMNLTTSIDQLSFNCDGQILGMSSRVKRDGFRLVHMPSCRTFSNWPGNGMSLGYVQCFDFSPNSGQLAIGNDKGKAMIFKLDHYPNA
eukprot:Partr_v1_DN29021_c0_g1_i2_m58797 putative UTP18, small subunit (SSU) processome component, homolog (yeast)